MTNNNTLTPAVLSDSEQQAIYQKLASELGLTLRQVTAFVKLYDDGATIPFIARYRKEQTQGLDDVQLRALEKSLNYERDMASRRGKIIELLTSQGKLTDELAERIANADSKLALEDIYLPYRPRRRSLASQAREAGLEPIALAILNDQVVPEAALADYQVPAPTTNEQGETEESAFADTEKQLAGIGAIIIDEWTQDLDLLDKLRTGFGKTAQVHSVLVSEEKREVGEKYKDYFDHSESLARLPNHRLLAMLRGRQDNVLAIQIEGEDAPFMEQIERQFGLTDVQPAERQSFLQGLAKKLWQDKWRPHIEHRLLTEKRLAAEAAAIDVFANNLQHLLMAAPAGQRVILGVDPGIRHGVKMAVVDSLGHVAKNANGDYATATVYPFAPDNKVDEAKAVILGLLQDHQVNLIAIGNGTASRETDALIKEVLAQNTDVRAVPVVVNESGASVYSASELAAAELPELDVSIRGAVSIARRLQDPLAELVKIDPKSIGVGQYQHDVNQTGLAKTLDAVVEDCVNAVGVDVNTASSAILGYIAGLNKAIAQQIVEYRKENGQFENRQALKKVPRLGERTFEQAAGFLRIQNGSEPLDASAVHPESYGLVERIVEAKATTVKDIIGNSEIIRQVKADEFVDDQFGLPTVQDVLAELEKPGRDPRPEFRTAKFREDITEVAQLTEGMQLEGVVTNVTNFGAFVDVGVHQDGLVHISELANEFVSDPHKVVKPGQIVQVRVLTVDAERNRVNLSMRPEGSQPPVKVQRPPRRDQQEQREERKPQAKRPQAARQNDQAKKPQRPKQDKPQDNKIGGFGALLLQAGIKGSK